MLQLTCDARVNIHQVTTLCSRIRAFNCQMYQTHHRHHTCPDELRIRREGGSDPGQGGDVGSAGPQGQVGGGALHTR